MKPMTIKAATVLRMDRLAHDDVMTMSQYGYL